VAEGRPEPGCKVLTYASGARNTQEKELHALVRADVDVYENTPHYKFGCIDHYDSKFLGRVNREWREINTRAIKVEVGARELAPGEKEALKICLSVDGKPSADTAGMLYEYAVDEQNTSSLFTKATKFTLTPGARRAAGSGRGAPQGGGGQCVDNTGDHFPTDCQARPAKETCAQNPNCRWVPAQGPSGPPPSTDH